VVQSVSELIDTGTPQGRLNLNLQLSLAEYERAVTCERNSAVARHLRQAARRLAIRPMVWSGSRAGCTATLKPGPTANASWPCARRARNGRPCSLERISEALHELGIPAPHGGRRWNKPSIARVIKTHEAMEHYPPAPKGQEAAVSRGELQ